MYVAVDRSPPGFGITAITTAGITRRYHDEDHVSAMIGRIEAPATQDTGIVDGASFASVGGLSILENMPTWFASRGRSIFGAIDRSLCFPETPRLQYGRRQSIRKEYPQILIIMPSQGAKEGDEDGPVSSWTKSIAVLSG